MTLPYTEAILSRIDAVCAQSIRALPLPGSSAVPRETLKTPV
jgi:hypothetical protein